MSTKGKKLTAPESSDAQGPAGMVVSKQAITPSSSDDCKELTKEVEKGGGSRERSSWMSTEGLKSFQGLFMSGGQTAKNSGEKTKGKVSEPSSSIAESKGMSSSGAGNFAWGSGTPNWGNTVPDWGKLPVPVPIEKRGDAGRKGTFSSSSSENVNEDDFEDMEEIEREVDQEMANFFSNNVYGGEAAVRHFLSMEEGESRDFLMEHGRIREEEKAEKEGQVGEKKRREIEALTLTESEGVEMERKKDKKEEMNEEVGSRAAKRQRKSSVEEKEKEKEEVKKDLEVKRMLEEMIRRMEKIEKRMDEKERARPDNGKEEIMAKLKELEEENRRIREENRKMKQELELLKNKKEGREKGKEKSDEEKKKEEESIMRGMSYAKVASLERAMRERETRDPAKGMDVRRGERSARKEEGVKVPRVRRLKEAVIIRTTKSSEFTDAIDKARMDLIGKGKADLINKVKGIRMTKQGGVLMEVERGGDSKALMEGVTEALGGQFRTELKQQKLDAEVYGIDPTIKEEDLKRVIEEEVSKGGKKEEVEIKFLRQNAFGTQKARLAVTYDAANIMRKMQRVRLGWTSCLTRVLPNVTRCYRCHDYGHRSYECTRLRQEETVCRRCGQRDHHISVCGALPSCYLCIEAGVPLSRTNHIAGVAPKCQRYIDAVSGRIRIRNTEDPKWKELRKKEDESARRMVKEKKEKEKEEKKKDKEERKKVKEKEKEKRT